MFFIATTKKVCEPRYSGKDAVKQKAPTPPRHNANVRIYKVFQHYFFLQISIQKFKLQIFPLSAFTDKGIFSLAVEMFMEHFPHAGLIPLDVVILDFRHCGEIQIKITNEREVIAYPLAVADVQTFGHE